MASPEKKLTLLPLTVIVTGNMMGSGIFLLPSSLAQLGTASLLGWGVTAIGAMIMALVFARLGILLPKAGGLYAFARAGIGRHAGFQVVYGYWFAAWVGNCAISLAGVGYLAHFLPVLTEPLPACLAAITVIWLLTALNSRKISLIGHFQSVTTACMLIPVAGLALIGWYWFEPMLLLAEPVRNDNGFWPVVTASTSLTLWAFLGLESACVAAGRVGNPERDVPRATIIGTLLAATLYILSTTVMMGIVPAAELAASTSPFSLVATQLFGNEAGMLVSLLAVIACFGCLNGWILLQGQIAKAAADDYLFPSIFGRVNHCQAPVYGLVITAFLMSGLLLLTLSPTLNRQYEISALIAVFIALMTYIYGLISSLVVLEQHRVRGRGAQITLVLSLIGVCYCFWAVVGAGEKALFYGCLAMLSSSVVYTFMRAWHMRQGIGHDSSPENEG